MTSRPIVPALTPIRMLHARAYKEAQEVAQVEGTQAHTQTLIHGALIAAETGKPGKAYRASGPGFLLPCARREYLTAIDTLTYAFRDLRTSERLAVAVA